MSTGFLHRRLRWRRIRLLLLVVALTLSFGFIVGGWIWIMFFRKGEIWIMLFGGDVDFGVGFLMVLLWCVGYAFSLMLVVRPLWRMRRPECDPDIVALTRYGPLAQMMSEIDREVEEEDGVISIGNTLKSIVPVPVETGELQGTRVLLTQSWLIHLRGEDGHRMSFMRLDSILAAYRPLPSGASERGRSVVLIDRHGGRSEIFGTDRGLARLLAHVLPRVPWALTRFDEEAERTWKEN
jgi:hypothetical protein